MYVLRHVVVIAGGCAGDGSVMCERVDVTGGGCAGDGGDEWMSMSGW